MAKYKKAAERESIIKEESFIRVYGWMVNKLNLKGNALMIYAIIHGFTNSTDPDINEFKGSLRYLADWTNSSKQAVINTLKQLIELKYIEKNPITVNGVNYVEYRSRMLYEGDKETLTRSPKTWTESVNYVDHDIQNSGHNNIVNTTEVTKGFKKEGIKDSKAVSPNTEDTPSLSEINDMKKQMAEMMKQMEEMKKEKEQVQEQVQEQGQNLEGGPLSKPNPSSVKEKDVKVKGEKEEGRVKSHLTQEELDALFDGFGFVRTEEPKEEEITIREEAEKWFM